MLYGFLMTLLVIDCIFLILFVLIQSGTGSGLASAFGGGSEDSLLGSKGNVTLNRWTSGLAAGFFILCCLLAWFSGRTERSVTADMSETENRKAGSLGEKDTPGVKTPPPLESLKSEEPAEGASKTEETEQTEEKNETEKPEGGEVPAVPAPPGSGLESKAPPKSSTGETTEKSGMQEATESPAPKEGTVEPPAPPEGEAKPASSAGNGAAGPPEDRQGANPSGEGGGGTKP